MGAATSQRARASGKAAVPPVVSKSGPFFFLPPFFGIAARETRPHARTCSSACVRAYSIPAELKHVTPCHLLPGTLTLPLNVHWGEVFPWNCRLILSGDVQAAADPVNVSTSFPQDGSGLHLPGPRGFAVSFVGTRK